MKTMWTRRVLPALLALCLVLVLIPAAQAETINGQKIVYGYSGEGRELCAYRYGTGPNVLVAGFALHGWEDHFKRDGEALVYTAKQLMESLSKSGLAQERGWSVYILPCINPDGLESGYSHDGPGRCTTRRYDSNGNLIVGGVDLNRCFPTNFTPQYTSRNYTGPSPMAAKEARALSDFLKKVKGSGTNLLIDTHGWYQQTIVYSTSSILYTAFHKYFPNNTDTIARNASGYLISYAHTLGYDSCLFEMPRDIYSMQDYYNSGYCGRYISSIEMILKSKSSVCAGGHAYEVSRTEPTCIAPGKEIKVCTRCGDAQTQTLNPLGHAADESSVTVVQKATATRDGLSTYTCRRCGTTGLEISTPKIFKDIKGTEYYCDAVDYGYENNLIKGMSQDTFGPNITLSRAMLVTMLYRYAGEPASDTSIPFVDVGTSSYYSDAVAWAYENGIVKGVTETRFCPNDPVTRQQTAALFHRYVIMLGQDNGVRDDLSGYTDRNKVSGYAQDAISWCVGNKIILGMTDTTLVPSGSATRAQSIVLLYRVIGYLNELQGE